MKKSKAFLCVALTVLLLFGAAACGGLSNRGSNAPEPPQGSSSGKEPITFTIRSVSSGNVGVETKETPVGAIMFEKTGVSFFTEYSVGDEMEVIALMIMSDDLADIVLPHYNTAPFVEAGAALELSGYIEKNAPLYKQRLGRVWDTMVWSMADKGRYYLSQPEQYPEQFDGKNWFMMQHAVVKELGFPKLVTLSDYENAIRDYMQINPTIDGQPTVGLTIITDSWLWILSLTNPAMMAAGTQSSGEYFVDPVTKKVTYRVLRDEETDYFRWLNHMYNEGLLDQESFTQTEDQYKEKIAQGRVLATTNMGWYLFWGPEQTLRQDGKHDRTYGAYPIVLREGIVNTSFSGTRQLSGGVGTAVVTTKCKNPERLFEAINWIISDEGQIYNNWGIEGEHYDIVNGKRVARIEALEGRESDPDWTKKTGIGCMNFGINYENGVKDSSGQYYTTSSKENMIATMGDVEKEVLAAYGKEIWADFFPQPEEFPMRMWPGESGGNTRLDADSPGAIAFQKVSDIVKTSVIRAIVAPPDKFDEEWAKFKDDMVKNGVDVFTEAIEENNKELMEMWGYDY